MDDALDLMIGDLADKIAELEKTVARLERTIKKALTALDPKGETKQ